MTPTAEVHEVCAIHVKEIPRPEDCLSEMRRLEDAVNKSEDSGLRARWQSGQCMLKMRHGKRLPNDALGTLVKELGVQRSELAARMKFAEKFQTEQELSDAIGQFKTWFAITHQALTTTPHVPKSVEVDDGEADGIEDDHEAETSTRCDLNSNLQRALALLNDVDYALLGEGDYDLVAKIEASIQRIKAAIATLKQVA